MRITIRHPRLQQPLTMDVDPARLPPMAKPRSPVAETEKPQSAVSSDVTDGSDTGMQTITQTAAPESPETPQTPAAPVASISLDWDRTLDDEGHLRRCPACGCGDLYARKQFPQLTGFALLLVAVIVATVLLGLGLMPLALVALAVILGLDVLFFLFSPHHLICYRCNSEYSRLPIHRDHPRWDAAIAEKYR